EAGRFLEGAETGTRFQQGQRLDLVLEAADPVTGALRFALPGVASAAPRRPRFHGEGRVRPASPGGRRR
ncbi:MAG: hypothetical protein ACK4Z0_09980, partial [Sphingomonadaceae bacterium]